MFMSKSNLNTQTCFVKQNHEISSDTNYCGNIRHNARLFTFVASDVRRWQ